MATTFPGWRGAFTLFWNGIICMNNPYPKPWKVRVRRIFNGWDGAVFAPAYAKILLSGAINQTSAEAAGYPLANPQIFAMNPAVIIYECLTNRVWGRGLDRALIDDVTFTACALTLFNEGFGLCLKWNRVDTIDSFIQQVLDTIGANMFPDRTTGKLRLKLIRADYNFADVPLFDANSGLVQITDDDILAPTEQFTECVVTYHDPITDTDRRVKVDNVASTQANGGVSNQMVKSYVGITTPDLALRVAQRDLRSVTRKLRRINATLDRRGSNVYPGDVIRIRDVARNIPDTVLRVATYDDGTLSDGRIKVGCVQDVFGLPATSFTGTVPPKWVAPATTPCIGRRRVVEMPYAAMVRSYTPADFAAIDPTMSFLGTLVEEGQPTNTVYNICVREGAPTDDDAVTDQSQFCGFSPS